MFIVEEIACRGATRIQFSIAFGHYKEFFKCVQHDRKKKIAEQLKPIAVHELRNI